MRLVALMALVLAAACGEGPPPPEGPTVLEVVPAAAEVGAPVVLRGSGFGATQGTSFVTVRGVNAAVASWSEDRLEIEVPAVAAGDTVIVVNLEAARSDPVAFTVVP